MTVTRIIGVPANIVFNTVGNIRQFPRRVPGIVSYEFCLTRRPASFFLDIVMAQCQNTIDEQIANFHATANHHR